MTISAVLLAGGKSSRMGQDKATLLFRGEPLWKTQLEILRHLQPAKIFVSAQNNPAWRPLDVEFVPDEGVSRGPLSGIVATLSKMDTEHLLVLGIDMPFMTAGYLKQLGARAQREAGVVCVIDGRAEPLAAVYPRTARVELATALAGSDFSLQPVVRKLVAGGKLSPVGVTTADRSLFRNLNEPTDLAEAGPSGTGFA